ncbi:MAG: hypothetical protein JWQ81_6456 [Amycolatopsis sp.]|jgi:hypothetical protein|uniref:DUF1707 SHOCT-like domain-containing protein n=1 Tax=Amycolatopsis sp. TaxID=37632 RepID=UPI0026055D21|nr:DUF1707 domain-containing protein [Amycolatopsis sp.]MCU1685717.1 hypothetical protein [Amycolatopsis sp.]
MGEEETGTTTQTTAETPLPTPVETPPAAEAPNAEPKPLSQRDLRVSDEEREHVVGVLQKAIGRGMLDLDEFTERTDIALAARTRGELNVVLTDLPGLIHRDAMPEQTPPATPWRQPNPYSQQPKFGRGERVELTAKYSSLNRSGYWVVPPAMLIRNKYGSTRLDFTEAHVEYPVVYIELDIRWGGVEIIIPDTANIDVNSISEIKFGSVEDKTRFAGPNATPRYVLTGRVHGGSLKIRHPRRGLFG